MRLVKNTLANLAASFLGPLLAIFMTPFYIRHLGLEGFGLVGFFGALNALLGIVSAAMGKVYLREVAGRTAETERIMTLPAMFQNFFAFFLLLGISVASIIFSLSWWISHRWVHLEHLSPATVQASILLISVSLAAGFPTGVCVDTLFALQEQVRANKATIGITLLTTAISAGLVYRYNSVLAFYAATSTGALVNLILLSRLAKFHLRNTLGVGVPWPSIAISLTEGRQDAIHVARSSLALIWTEGAGVAITQTDRMLLSSFLPLSNLGIYGVAASVGRVVQLVCGPFLSAGFPKLCQVAATSPSGGLGAREAFRQQTIVLVLACTVSLPICAIPETLLELWIGKTAKTSDVASITVVFALAYAFLALAGAPYNLAVATGHTRYAAAVNTIAMIWYPLLGWLLISRLGLLGAAFLWLTYCAHVFLACTIVAMRRIDPLYCSVREGVNAFAVPVLAVLLGLAVKVIPSVSSYPAFSRLLYAGIAAILLFSAGLLFVFGPGDFARFFSTARTFACTLFVAARRER